MIYAIYCHLLETAERSCDIGGGQMEKFIHNANIRHYRKLLEEEADEAKRAIIRKLLAEEEARELTLKPEK